MPIRTQEAVQAQRTDFDREHLILEAQLVDGRGLMAALIDQDCGALAGTGLSELEPGVRES